MRTNIVIDDELVEKALKSSDLTTKKEAVEAGLRALILLNQQRKIRQYQGKLLWDGDLDDMRTDS